MRRWTPRVLIAAALAGIPGCAPAAKPAPPPAVARIEAPAPAAAKAYEVLKQGGDSTKDSWHVLLRRKATKDKLEAYASEIRRGLGTGKGRAYFWFHFPYGEPLSYLWASLAFEPGLRVEIRGLTPEDEAKLIPRAPRRADAVGQWIDDGSGRRIMTIYREGDGTIMETTGSSGSSDRFALADLGEQRFERKDGSAHGEFYAINESGGLEIHAETGLYATMRPLVR